jgi:hypothetical protein
MPLDKPLIVLMISQKLPLILLHRAAGIGRGCVKRIVLLCELASTGKSASFFVSPSKFVVAASKISPPWSEIIGGLSVGCRSDERKTTRSGRLQLFHDLRYAENADGPFHIVGQHM